ncbi:hypothetical protein AA0112_g9341 [Alternaria arborescens]|nr:hypothetical protein AA0112_g9341 [Alternaria arborescens]
MPLSTFQGLLLSLLLLANVAIAGRYSFIIKEVRVEEVRDVSEDDLLLAIASTTGNNTIKNSWLVGKVHAGGVVKPNDTVKFTQEIDVPATASNLSVAIGGLNTDDANEQLAFSFVEGIVAIAGAIPGPQALPAKLLSIVFGAIGDFSNCTGPVIIGNAVYTLDQLNDLEQNQEVCETKSFGYEVPLLCSPTFKNSSYTVDYCLERLDAKSAAANSSPGLVPLFTSLAVAIIYSGL